MALTVVNREFKDDQNRTLGFLLANSLDYIRATYTVEPFFGMSLSGAMFVMKDGNKFTLSSGSWEDFGFVAGDTLTVNNLGGYGLTETAVISYVDGAVLMCATSISGSYDSYNIGDFYVTKNPEGFNVDFNIIKNSDPLGLQSLIDGEQQRFTVDAVSSMAVNDTLTMTQLGNPSGASTMTATVKRIADVSSRRRYEIALSFYLWPWVDGSSYEAGECVKPYIKIDALPQYNNPGLRLTATNSNLGNTGWKDENWNGGTPAYTPDSIVWTDDNSNTLDAFDYSQPSNFEITVNGAFTSGSKLQFKMFFPSDDDEDFKNLTTDHSKNTIATIRTAPISVATPVTFTSAVHPSGASYTVNAVTVTQFTTYAVITGRIVPNAAFTTLMESRDESNRKYRLWVRCENPSYDYNSSNAVNVEVDYDTAVKTPVPLGAYPLVKAGLRNHKLQNYFISGTRNVITEDDVQKWWLFRLPKNERYQSITGRVRAYNTVTEESFTLDEHVISLDQWPILSDGTMPISYTQPRGYKLPPSCTLNDVVLSRAPSFDTGGAYGVNFYYPFLSRWEDWLAQDNASNDFYGDKTKEWRHYDLDADWVIQTELEILTDDGAYSNTENFGIRTYDDWTGTSVFTFFKTDGTPITAPLSDQICKVVCTHTPNVQTNGAYNVWGMITVEPFENAPRWSISTVYAHGGVVANPLQPLSGETQLKVTTNNTNIVFECLFDPSKINIANDVKFTSRINCVPRKKDPDKELKYRTSTGATGNITVNMEQELLTTS